MVKGLFTHNIFHTVSVILFIVIRITVRIGPSPILSVITVGNSSCGKVMISQVCVKNSVQGGVCLWVWGYTLPGRHPRGQTPLPRQPLQQRTVRILLECILVHTVTIGTMLNNNGGNNEHELKNVTSKLTVKIKLIVSLSRL